MIGGLKVLPKEVPPSPLTAVLLRGTVWSPTRGTDLIAVVLHLMLASCSDPRRSVGTLVGTQLEQEAISFV